MYSVYIIIVVLDVITTHIVLYQGVGYEGNPLMAWVFTHVGIWADVPVRIAFGSITIFIVERLRKVSARATLIFFALGLLIQAFWVVNNFIVIVTGGTSLF